MVSSHAYYDHSTVGLFHLRPPSCTSIIMFKVKIPGSNQQDCCTSTSMIFYKKLKNVSCEYNRLNGWNSTLQAAWYRRVRIIWFLWTKPTIWLLINIVRACSMFYPYEGYRSVTPLDAAKVNRTIFHNHSVHWYYINLIKGRDYIKHDINVRHGKQNPRRGRWL